MPKTTEQDPTSRIVRVLLLEDNSSDAKALAMAIGFAASRQGLKVDFSWTPVAWWMTRPDFDWSEFDLVVADAAMPASSANPGKLRWLAYQPLPGSPDHRIRSVPPPPAVGPADLAAGGMSVAETLAVGHRRPERLRFMLVTSVSADPALAKRANQLEGQVDWFVLVPKPRELVPGGGVGAAAIGDGVFQMIIEALLRDRRRADWGLKPFHEASVIFRAPATRRLVLDCWSEIVRLRAARRRGTLVLVGEHGLGRSVVAAGIARLFGVPDAKPMIGAGASVQDLKVAVASGSPVLWITGAETLASDAMVYLHTWLRTVADGVARLVLLESDCSLRERLPAGACEFQLPSMDERELDLPGILAAQLADLGWPVAVGDEWMKPLQIEFRRHPARLQSFATWCVRELSHLSPIPPDAIERWKMAGSADRPEKVPGTEPKLPALGSELRICIDPANWRVTFGSNQGDGGTLEFGQRGWPFRVFCHWLGRTSAGLPDEKVETVKGHYREWVIQAKAAGAPGDWPREAVSSYDPAIAEMWEELRSTGSWLGLKRPPKWSQSSAGSFNELKEYRPISIEWIRPPPPQLASDLGT